MRKSLSSFRSILKSAFSRSCLANESRNLASSTSNSCLAALLLPFTLANSVVRSAISFLYISAGLAVQPFSSPSLKKTFVAVGLLDGSWDQHSSTSFHNLSSNPWSVSACGWGLAGRLSNVTTFLRNDDKLRLMISLKGMSPENI